MKGHEALFTPCKPGNVKRVCKSSEKQGKTGISLFPSDRCVLANEVQAMVGKNKSTRLAPQMQQLNLIPCFGEKMILSLDHEIVSEEEKFSSRGLICCFNTLWPRLVDLHFWIVKIWSERVTDNMEIYLSAQGLFVLW